MASVRVNHGQTGQSAKGTWAAMGVDMRKPKQKKCLH